MPRSTEVWFKKKITSGSKGMTQILDALETEGNGRTLCGYVNVTNEIQIARITNIPGWYFERVVFPKEYLLFEAPPDATLEIYRGEMSSVTLLDKIACDRLQVSEASEPVLA